jgi:hypothetical protein
MSAVIAFIHDAMQSAMNQLKILSPDSNDWPRQDINQFKAGLSPKNGVS